MSTIETPKRKRMGGPMIAVLVGVAMLALLYTSGRNRATALTGSGTPHANASDGASPMAGPMTAPKFDVAAHENDVRASLAPALKPHIEALHGKVGANPTSPIALASLAGAYNGAHQPLLAGYYYQKAAVMAPKEDSLWRATGDAFYNAQGIFIDSATYLWLANQSIDAYQKALALNPTLIDAKVNLAAGLVEARGEVMQGVGLLKEIEQEHPTHRKTLLYLGILSMQSGQFDKAIGRFQKLTEMPQEGDPNYPYYFRYLGQAYGAAGNKASALGAYTKYLNAVKDPRLKTEAQELIQSVR